jgi:perosamine synthetase
VRITADAPVSRDEFVATLAEYGVGSGVYYPRLVFDYDCYRDHPRVVIPTVPVAAAVVDEVVSLPVHPWLSAADLDTIVSAVRKVMSA